MELVESKPDKWTDNRRQNTTLDKVQVFSLQNTFKQNVGKETGPVLELSKQYSQQWAVLFLSFIGKWNWESTITLNSC